MTTSDNSAPSDRAPAFIDDRGVVRHWNTAAKVPDDWVGIAQSIAGGTFFAIGREAGERSFTAIKATSYQQALRESKSLTVFPDPAHHPYNVAVMAEGANRRTARERAISEAWFERSDERLQQLKARQPTWQAFKPDAPGATPIDGLRVEGDPYIAVPATGRRNSASFVVFDVRDTTEPVCYLNKDEVVRWLVSASSSEAVMQYRAAIAGTQIPATAQPSSDSAALHPVVTQLNKLARYAGVQPAIPLENAMEPKITTVDFMNSQIIDRGQGNIVVKSDLDAMVRDENYPKEVRWALSTMMSLMVTHYALGVPVSDARYGRGLTEVFNGVMDRARSAIRSEIRSEQGMGM